MRLSNCNAHQVLITCFRRFTAYRGANQIYSNAPASTIDSRLDRLCDDKIAAAVIGFVDRLDPVSRAYCYYCFSPDHSWDQAVLLSNTVMDRFVEKNVDMRKDRLVYTAKLSIFVAEEYRFRINNPTKTKHTWDQLSGVLGIRKEHFRGAGSQVWSGLLDEMGDIALKADTEVINFVKRINHLDAKPHQKAKASVDKSRIKKV